MKLILPVLAIGIVAQSGCLSAVATSEVAAYRLTSDRITIGANHFSSVAESGSRNFAVSTKTLGHNMTVVDRRCFTPAVVCVGKVGMINSQCRQDSRMQIVNVHLFFDSTQAKLIGLTYDVTFPHRSPRQPHRKAERIMVATISLFTHRGTAKLATPYNEGFL